MAGRRRTVWTNFLSQAKRGSDDAFIRYPVVVLTPPLGDFAEDFLEAGRFGEDEDFFGISVCFLKILTDRFHYSAFRDARRSTGISLFAWRSARVQSLIGKQALTT
ncbi:MAG: hypothetical protein ANABAC_2391 [Anaerolineae bacterium]|nr:MAG: hypothetical protein ANABAC_2391 [Anaerolineae bacterium]